LSPGHPGIPTTLRGNLNRSATLASLRFINWRKASANSGGVLNIYPFSKKLTYSGF
jgi:hypothetical protein